MESMMEDRYTRESTINSIRCLRAKAMKDLEAICQKYANIKEDGEGFRIEDIEKYYKSDEESEQEKEEEEIELRQERVVHIHRIYSKSMRNAPIDILIKESESKKSLDKPNVEHKRIMRKLRLTSRSRYASSEDDDIDINCNIRKSVRVKVRRSNHKRTYRHHHHCAAPYPVFIPHLHAPPMYTYAPYTPTMCTYTPSMYPCLPHTHAHSSCCICKYK